MQSIESFAPFALGDAPTWVWSLGFMVVSWWYMGLQSRRAAKRRLGKPAATAGAGHETAEAAVSTILNPTALPLAMPRDMSQTTKIVPDASASLYEPAPPSDPVLRSEVVGIVSRLEAAWAASGDPMLDDGRLKVWHRHEGGAIHSFKYEVIMPVAPGPCVALAKEMDLMPSWHKFVPVGAVLGSRPGIFGGIWAYAEVWMPWPLKNRSMLCSSAFYDCLDDGDLGAIIVHVGSVDDSPGSPLPPGSEEALAALPTTPEESPRLSFESYNLITPLEPGPDGADRTLWTFYFGEHLRALLLRTPAFLWPAS